MSHRLAVQRLQLRLRRRAVSRRPPTIRLPRTRGLRRHTALNLGLNLGLSLALGAWVALSFPFL